MRKVEGVMRMDRMRSNDIRERQKQEDVLKTVLRRNRDWPKKIEEMPEERLAKTVYVCGEDARKLKRPRGRPRKRLEDDLI